MTKEEIIKLLDLKVGLFKTTENENSLGELYISELQFKEIDKVLIQLKRREKEADVWANKLRKIVEGNERFIILKDTNLFVENKVIHLPLPLIIIDGQNLFSRTHFKGKAAFWRE